MAESSGIDFDRVIDRRLVPALKMRPSGMDWRNQRFFAASVADMDFEPPPSVLVALRERLEHGVFGYEGFPAEVLEALVDWQASRHQWSVGGDEILRSPNILNALAMAVNEFTDPGDGVIVQPPVFFDFFDILRENDRRLVSNPLRFDGQRYEMDFTDLEHKASQPTTRMLLLCNPHNPVGRVWSREELHELATICARHDVLVVSDEIHADIVYPGLSYSPFAVIDGANANAIICISPAKTFNIASCCSAFTVIPDRQRRERFQAANSRLTVNKNNAFASAAMLAAYRDGGPWVDALAVYLSENLSLLRAAVNELDGVRVIEPEGTFLVWMDFSSLGLDCAQLGQFLRNEARWVVTRGEAFGDEGRGFARVNIACRRETLELALEGLSLALR